MAFNRLRRLRRNNQIREVLSQTEVLPKDLIMPYFVIEGRNKKEPIDSMPGISRLSVDNLIEDAREANSRGIKAILLFGVSGKKDASASEAYRRNGVVQRAIRAIKKNIKSAVIITDVCLCGYTAHGHCGIVKGQEINNDETLKVLARIALSHAQAGADFVAPSAMMDGQVKTIREALDKNRLDNAGILAYSAKYASNFYGPFREALDSRPKFGDRKSYQLDFRNSDEALREIEEDIKEGADIVMVKPALAYLDIISKAKQKFNIPVAAYNVSGEYAMVKRYCQASSIPACPCPSLPVRQAGGRRAAGRQHPASELEKNLILEILTAIKRAGADLIITYHAKEYAAF